MRKIFFLTTFLISMLSLAQNYTITGVISDLYKPLPKAVVKVEEIGIEAITDENGNYSIVVPKGDYTVSISLEGYTTIKMIWSVGENTTMPVIYLEEDITQTRRNVVSLSDEEVDSEETSISQVSGLLQATKDLYLQRSAYDFSQVFYKPRGYDSKEIVTLVNGIPMNRIETGRAQWSNWSGLNDFTRAQVVTPGVGTSQDDFGGAFGTTSISVLPSQLRKGLKVSLSSSNRTYAGRAMVTYNSGLQQNKFGYTISASRRWTKKHNYIEGTLNNSYGLATALEYRPLDIYAISFVGIYSFNHRGKTAPLTQEAISLAGRRYNPNWGYLNGDLRNSKMKTVAEPIFILSQKYEKNDTRVGLNIGYQFGKQGDTRIQYVKSQNPDPTYYTNMPTYFYANYSPTDPKTHDPFAYEKTLKQIEYFKQNQQLNWEKLYMANKKAGGESLFALNEDVIDSNIFSANLQFYKKINDRLYFNSTANYQNTATQNYQQIEDLMGGEYFLNKSYFSGDWYNTAQEKLKEGDKYQYHYKINSQKANVFAQMVFKHNKTEAYVAGKFDHTRYKRDGQFQNNEIYKDSKGESLYNYFNSVSAKAGVNYSITGRHIVQFNAGYLEVPHTVTSIYVNVRGSNSTLPLNLKSERQSTADVSYFIRMPYFKSKITAYATSIKDAIEKNYFFTQARVGDESAGFLTETMAEIEKLHCGVEWGGEVQIIPEVKATAVVSLNKYKYTNNPTLMYSSDKQIISTPVKTYMKNYRLAAGPERVYSLGLEYRGSSSWSVGATANLFDKNFIDAAPMLRTTNIYKDPTTGTTYQDIDPDKVRELLKQEELPSLFLVNVSVGKSWRIKGKYINLFVTANNILNKQFKIGGFEQARKGDYKAMIKDRANGYPVFGNKYFVGLGANYLANLAISF